MIKLEGEHYKQAYNLYRRSDYFFPLIASVLLNEQDGVVYADNSQSPSQVFIEHSFGFSQLIGKPSPPFNKALENYLLVKKGFCANKVRLYAPSLPDFLSAPHFDVSLSERQRFHLDRKSFSARKDAISINCSNDIRLYKVETTNVDLVQENFEIVNRFWRNPDDFVNKANSSLLTYKGKPAAICYAAAIADKCAEIDVLTLPQYRKLGLARFAVTRFIENCQNANIQPLWDCFTNNDASMMLAQSVGFVPYNSPYKFVTIG